MPNSVRGKIWFCSPHHFEIFAGHVGYPLHVAVQSKIYYVLTNFFMGRVFDPLSGRVFNVREECCESPIIVSERWGLNDMLLTTGYA